MSHPDDERFEGVIERARLLGMSDPADARWPSLLGDALACAAFVAWATHHPRWCHDVAEVADRVCAKPLEAAAAIVASITADSLGE